MGVDSNVKYVMSKCMIVEEEGLVLWALEY